MIGDIWAADRTEKDRVALREQRDSVVVHHRASCMVVVTTPRKLTEFKPEPDSFRDDVKDTSRRRDRFPANPIPWNGCDDVIPRVHNHSFSLWT
ncbi:unannotated protein [freshwater metagenome]|uniref:Unannotated protein n=1 Tax=freshwater metagenome TaxID=449393 RepID=A0A6J6UAB0_9ZZZZ